MAPERQLLSPSRRRSNFDFRKSHAHASRSPHHGFRRRKDRPRKPRRLRSLPAGGILPRPRVKYSSLAGNSSRRRRRRTNPRPRRRSLRKIYRATSPLPTRRSPPNRSSSEIHSLVASFYFAGHKLRQRETTSREIACDGERSPSPLEWRRPLVERSNSRSSLPPRRR